MTVQTRTELKQYILECLGAPLIEINITDNQMENMIDDALLFFQEYYWDGTNHAYYTHIITAAEKASGMIQIPDYVYGVSRAFSMQGFNASNLRISLSNPLSAGYQLVYDALAPVGSGGNLIYFEQVMQHLSTIQAMLIAEPSFTFNRLDGLLTMTDTGNLDEGRLLCLEVYTSLRLDQPNKIWNERTFKQYCVAKCKQQWGNNLSKYQGMQLPGGVTVDSNQMISSATEEITKIEDRIMNSQAPLPIYIA